MKIIICAAIASLLLAQAAHPTKPSPRPHCVGFWCYVFRAS